MFRKGAISTLPRRFRSAPWALLLAVTLVVVPGVAGCSAERSRAGAVSGPTAAVGVSGTHQMPNGMQMTTAEMDASWMARPQYTRVSQQTEAAYAYAMRAWNIVQWLPCYCGCEGMGHGSNLDCYYKPMPAGSRKVAFEEHASYCDICVEITLTAKRLAGEGKSLREIRAAVDREFGGAGPGTDTPLPAS